VLENINKHLQIRKAQPSDKFTILNFCKDTFAWGDYIDIVWDSWLNDPSGLLVVVDRLDSSTLIYEPVAVSHISICQNNFLWIEGLRVNKTFRNQGIATCLLRYMVNYGVKQGLGESCALVSNKNVISKRILEKEGFSANAICRYYSIKIEEISKLNGHSLVLKHAHIHDIESIQNYLDNSEVYSKMDGRYFNEWKFYRLKNTFECICDLISKEKLILAVDGNNKINGVSIINITGEKALFYNKPLLQVCYLDCLDYSLYSNFIRLLLETLGTQNQHKDIHFFVENSIDLCSIFDDANIDNFEKFIIYGKKLT
jgi:hypothetical protein